MSKEQELQDRLIEKLKELFQLDQPELDFGFYRIMHAKKEQIEEYLHKDLPKTIKQSIKVVGDHTLAEYQKAYDEAVESARNHGVENPQESKLVKEAKADLDAAKKRSEASTEIYDHLYRFFDRYYENGDFMSRRYRTNETDTKAAPYAIPYNGEEVMLHWANSDQYYIKTDEYYSNFNFNLREAKEIRDRQKLGELEFDKDEDEKPLNVYFRVVDAEEGEHNNVKPADNAARKFKPYAKQPVELNDDGELIINFEVIYQTRYEYIYDKEMEKRLRSIYGSVYKRDMEPLAAAQVVFDALDSLEGLDPAYGELLRFVPPPAKKADPPILARYYRRFAAKNTMDYFIHKDLGGFLRRELDFYIKNEVMHLVDLENASGEQFEGFLNKIRALRTVAHDIIDFLAQLENFQKKLWLKKKFVVETNYCITLDRIPEPFYPEIAANQAQIQEWIDLFAIDELAPPPYSTEFLKENDKLVVDTRFFDEDFKARLIATIDDFDEQCDGLLIHSENFQALNLFNKNYSRGVETVYIDPPYNSPSSEVMYKNSFKHSAWLGLMSNRLELANKKLSKNTSHVIAIDKYEQARLSLLVKEFFSLHQDILVTVVHNRRGTQGDLFSYSHEYALFLLPQNCRSLNRKRRNESEYSWSPLRNWGGESLRTDARNCFYPIIVDKDNLEGIKIGEVSPDDYHPPSRVVEVENSYWIYPIDNQGVERKWRYAQQTVGSVLKQLKIDSGREGLDVSLAKIDDQFKTVWEDPKYNAGDYGTSLLSEMGFSKDSFSFPKSLYNVRDAIYAVHSREGYILDYFAGSGTTGHAVIDLNREDGGNRKYILVEMGDYFDTVLKPRIAKVVYSKDWKNGKPTARDTGVSHCFKYIRLESYEDALNNLSFYEERSKAFGGNQALKRDYTLRYMLDVETKGSDSLLNIDRFADPTNYTLMIKKPGSLAQEKTRVDLVETFNYLIGLRVVQLDAPEIFDAKFHRPIDPELPEDQHTKLEIEGGIEQVKDGPYWFRTITGWVPADPENPNSGERENVLVVWRKLTGELEKDNAVLDAYFEKKRINTRDFEFDVIYVNGSNNLPNLRRDDESWKVRLLEEEFMTRMWDVEDS